MTDATAGRAAGVRAGVDAYASESKRNGKFHFLRAIGIAALIVTVLDGSDAVIYFGIVLGLTPQQLFRNIAVAVLGHAALSLGWFGTMVGVCLHISVALTVTAIYFLLSRRFATLVHWPYLWGPIYGIVVHYTMRYVVLPLTLSHPISTNAPFWMSYLINELLAHVFLVGLPIALMAQRAAAGSSPYAAGTSRSAEFRYS